MQGKQQRRRGRKGEQFSERYLLLPKLDGKIDLPVRKIKGKERIKPKKSTCSYITTKMLAAQDSLKLESSLRKSTHPETFR